MNIIQRTLLLTILSACSCAAVAHDMAPAAKPQGATLLKNATVHTVLNGTLSHTDLLLEQGKIKTIGSNLSAAEARVIDLTGKHIYPGLIALDTTLGLTEISMVRSSNDTSDIGDDNPQLLAAAAYNPDSELLPTVRANGITHAQSTPRGDGLAGQSLLVNLDAWTIEDATHTATGQYHLYWPELPTVYADKARTEKAAEAYQQAVKRIKQHFNAAYRYQLGSASKQHQKEDIRWQALMPLFKGHGKLFVHADQQQAIEEAAALARQYQLPLVIVGGYDAWRLAEVLNEQHAAVIYTHCLDLPARPDEPIGQAFKIPGLLKKVGIPFAIGFSGDWDSRNLPLAAAQTVAWGLTQEEALKAITYDAAQIVGATGLGAIAEGYDASLVVSDGDILDPMTSKIEALYIDGRQIDLNNRHRQLYQKYLKR
ncbi:amidohydrolase family protein [Shewanella dokdonensis]|uniref:amidohydrolase family protein n=1 Tax=Shewanella dokdonensis TaxID=712036 RepID=UPI00200F0510|nr:amidohydrolase family protein [Shewanella dokdonensis]